MMPGRLLTAFIVAVFAADMLEAQDTSAKRSCVVLQELSASTPWRSDAAACSTRLSPASTFKIPHALVALETGVVAADTVERWDGTRHPEQPLWNRDHTVLTAMRPSVLWFFQRIAPRVGGPRMHEWLTRMQYGNADTGGEITRYWINGRLRISPDEQVTFLKQFYAGTLPITKERQRLVREALIQKPGTVENARGVHPVGGRWSEGTVLNSKTGATTLASGESTSWLVGALTVGNRQHVFASAVWRDKGGVDQLDAARLAVATFIDQGLLPRAK